VCDVCVMHVCDICDVCMCERCMCMRCMCVMCDVCMCVVSSVDTCFDLSLDCDEVLQPYVKICLSVYGRREERKEAQQSEPRARLYTSLQIFANTGLHKTLYHITANLQSTLQCQLRLYDGSWGKLVLWVGTFLISYEVPHKKYQRPSYGLTTANPD
jgi:hypothetical protein